MQESIIEQVNKCVSLMKRMGEKIDTSSYRMQNSTKIYDLSVFYFLLHPITTF